MKYLLQNYPGSSVEAFEQLSADEQQAIVDEYLALRQFPGILTGEQLQPIEAATTVRVQNRLARKRALIAALCGPVRPWCDLDAPWHSLPPARRISGPTVPS